MAFALTTRWNAGRHADGEPLIEEILDMGFRHVELGYDTRLELVPGVRKMVESGAVHVDSVHNFCPVPLGAPYGHPELFTLADPDPRVRESAISHTSNTVRFAAEIGARVVVVHAGNVAMKRMSDELAFLCERGERFSPRYEKKKLKLQLRRDKKARKQVPFLVQGLERLLPVLTETGVALAIENLPTWESIPLEVELERILTQLDSEHLKYWHDIGHAQIRENLGFINQERWLERLSPFLAGMHLHDVAPPARDHLMPPQGTIDFPRFARFARMPFLKVIEPTPRTPRADIEEALRYLRETWEDAGAASGPRGES